MKAIKTFTALTMTYLLVGCGNGITAKNGIDFQGASGGGLATPTPVPTATPIGATPTPTPRPTATPLPTTTPVPTATPMPTPTPPGSWDTGFFPSDAIWYKDIRSTAKDAQSDSIINWLSNNGGWGTGSMRVDFSFNILQMVSSTPFFHITPEADYYAPDCSDGLTSFPLPVGGAIEGEDAYRCTEGGDCHILVVDPVHKKLYESGNDDLVGSNLHTMCAIVWDLNKHYGEKLRGDQCTSTDAAGFPIAPLLFTADEIAAGEIKHAIRFILPNPRMAARVYVRPATHAGGPSGPSTAVPYGARFRLKANYDLSRLKPGAQVVARAMQKYGMLLADGGNIALTAASDRFTQHKYNDSNVDFSSYDLSTLQVSDFEMVEAGARIPLTYDCVREPGT